MAVCANLVFRSAGLDPRSGETLWGIAHCGCPYEPLPVDSDRAIYACDYCVHGAIQEDVAVRACRKWLKAK